MKENIFLFTLFFEAVYACILCISILVPKNRVLPPSKENNWQNYMIWVSFLGALLGAILLGFLDRGNFVLGHWSRFVVGGILVFIGSLIYYRTKQDLGWKMMIGDREKRVLKGLYRYSRNPIYVGDSFLLLGAAIMCNSLLVYIVAINGIFLFCLTPVAEESWLQEESRVTYDQYLAKVPRFFPSLFYLTRSK